MSAMRCYWCGVFVAKTTKPVGWRVKVGRLARQNPRSPWNYWSRLLCPSCAPSTALGGFERVPVDEVTSRHASGWDPERPYQRMGAAA